MSTKMSKDIILGMKRNIYLKILMIYFHAERSSTKLHAPPGGASTFSLGNKINYNLLL